MAIQKEPTNFNRSLGTIKKMKKRTKIIIILLVAFIALFFYGSKNFENDKNHLLHIKTLAANGNVLDAFNEMEENQSFTNPLINIAYNKWKNKFYSRFVNKDEIIEPNTDNKVVNDISNIYREYWINSSFKKNKQVFSDSILTSNLYDYLQQNGLTDLTRNQLEKSSFEEVKKVIESQNAYSASFYLNETYGLKIWDKQAEKKYTIELPLDTLTISVVFIENYLLKGVADFTTMGIGKDGGWSSNSNQSLYCNKGEYDLNSEKFKLSYLKHEANHFVDVLKYPNLSSTDLEYRSKIIELMYCSKETIYKRIAEFINSASSKERTHSHPYANYSLIKGMSKLLFNSEYESEYDKWKNTSVEVINNAAKQLYNQSGSKLLKDKNASEII
jgi:hypothetical protein